ncbi:MAG: TonB-dependent receptor [Crocinitomicaceae bacterium]|nr:TonB-dependent receptor [Crocinitomicaceae bacterium]
MKQLSLLFFLSPFVLFSQVTGSVKDKTTRESLIGAKVFASNNQQSISDVDGKFVIQTTLPDFPLTVVTTMVGYENDTLVVQQAGDIIIYLSEPSKTIETVVVTAGRRGQKIEEVTISMDVLKPELIDNKGFRDLEDAIGQTPGVHTMDGQVSIRGGSGFAYGAGSRVMLLWNGMPLLTADAGDAKFNSVPMESASQIEVIKGASSVLYGSGALNGIISLSEREPTTKGETRVKIQHGIYDNPKRASLKWWSSNPTFHMAEIYHGKMYKKFGFTVSANGVSADGYRQGEDENRGRITGTLFFLPQKVRGLKAGIGFNAQLQRNTNFIIWQSDSLGYQPSGGAVPGDSASTLGHFRGIRINVDPYVRYVDKYNNTHSLKTRMYYVQNKNIYNPGQTSSSVVSYADYQFQRKYAFGMTLTTGLTGVYNWVNSNLYGQHNSINSALYLQLEQKLWEKLDLTAGVRAEYFEQDGRQGDSHFYFKDSTAKLPVYPIFRAGIHYEPVKGTHLRTSYGQGIRYPSVAERYTVTNVGALNIFPNANLTPEKGWAAEIGIKQIIPIGRNWKGIIDVAGFVNHYENMMEFEFGIYNPDTIPLSINPSDPGFLGKWIGFRAANNESARITGFETSFSSIGTIGNVEIASLIGYTYMDPVSLNRDSSYVTSLSSYEIAEDGTPTWDNTLKYRFRHLFRGDIEVTWKGIGLGFSARYNSRVVNIDRVFEESIVGTEILPGLKEYRKNYDNGALAFDARVAYKFLQHYRFSFIVNNFLNAEYTTRPGDIQAPRSFMIQFQATF